MRLPRWLPLLASAAAIAAALLWGWCEHRRRQQADRDRIRWEQRLTVLRSQLRSHRAAAATAVTAAEITNGPSLANQRAGRWATLADSPGLRRKYLSYYRQSLDARFGAFFVKMHLSPDQIEKFEDYQVHERQEQLDFDASTEDQGLQARDKAYLALWQSLNRTLLDLDHAFFPDPADFDAYREFLRTGTSRDLAASVASAASEMDTPLTFEQSEALADVLTSASVRGPSHWIRPGTVNWTSAASGAATLLTPEQMNAFNAVRGANEIDQQINALFTKVTGQPSYVGMNDLIRAAGPLPTLPAAK